MDSINFGQKIDYKTEAKETFVKQDQTRNQNTNTYKDKFTKPNINFGSVLPKDQMQTVSMTVNKDGGVKSA